MNKKYTYKKLWDAFKLPSKTGIGGFPTTCIECGSTLSKNDDFDYMSEWTISFTCIKCGQKYAYQPSDMGQTVPWIKAYDDKNKLFE